MSTNKSFTLLNYLKPRLSHKIHASCNRSHMFRIQRDLMIRKWRVIENFKVSGVGKRKYSPC
ncbi:hypothetical protein IGI04_021678 [Brassica rapa subsp. trilocularis]|uniref:Uncharacterized protein n=2 Tax=Brassica TaxID=3705 RepID=A0ABQ8CVT9_BRANA|nr:hypothetical protein IGI04_021678 [Brassica rapa subsp. trilocularis]KAH0921131.1 hypothetical protein HID58_021149 [Brassica napus]